MYVCIYIYIYIYMSVCVYLCMYVDRCTQLTNIEAYVRSEQTSREPYMHTTYVGKYATHTHTHTRTHACTTWAALPEASTLAHLTTPAVALLANPADPANGIKRIFIYCVYIHTHTGIHTHTHTHTKDAGICRWCAKRTKLILIYYYYMWCMCMYVYVYVDMYTKVELYIAYIHRHTSVNLKAQQTMHASRLCMHENDDVHVPPIHIYTWYIGWKAYLLSKGFDHLCV